jgi:hypothetical protein
MRIWKIAALMALAAIPILLISNRKREDVKTVQTDPDNIFESELSVE